MTDNLSNEIVPMKLGQYLAYTAHAEKRSTSAYEEYGLRIEEYELRTLYAHVCTTYA